jgi:hypothetical protein
MENWDKLVLKTAEILQTHEKYQRVLGQIAFEAVQEYGKEAIDGLAEDVKETHGIQVSLSTLKNYEFVYRSTKDLELPLDLSYRTLQYIASSGKPEYWAERINKEGLSSAEVYRLIRLDKGLEKKVKIIICPSCGKEIKE